MLSKLNINCNSRWSLLLHVVDVFSDFMHLRHKNNLLNNFLHDMRHLNESINWVNNWNDFIFSCVEFFVLSLNLIVDISHGNNSIHFNDLIFVDLNLVNLFDNFALFHYFFLNGWDLHYFLLNADRVDYFFNKFFYDIVARYDYWFFGSYLYKFRNFYSLLHYFLDLVNFRHFIVHLNYFITVNWNLHYSLFDGSCDNRLFFANLNFFYFFRNIRYNFLDLFNFFLDNALLLHSRYFLNCRHFFYAFNYLLHLFGDFFDLLNFLLNDN